MPPQSNDKLLGDNLGADPPSGHAVECTLPAVMSRQAAPAAYSLEVSIVRRKRKRRARSARSPKNVQCILRLKRLLSFGPPGPNAVEQSRGDKDGPRDQSQQKDRHVIPERFFMLIEVSPEACQVVLQNEDPEKLWIFNLNRYVPGQGDRTKENNPRNPKGAYNQYQVCGGYGKNNNDCGCQKRCHGPFRQGCQSQRNVEQREVTLRSTLIPTIPAEQCDREHRRKWHIHGRGAGKANHSRCRGCHQGAIELKPWTKTSQK